MSACCSKFPNCEHGLNNVNIDTGVLRCKIKHNFEYAGKMGELLTTVMTPQRIWAVVIWDGEDEPELYKADALLIGHTETHWKNLTAQDT